MSYSLAIVCRCYWVIFSPLLVTQVNSSTYYISLSPDDDWCPVAQPCFVLSEIAAILSNANGSDSYTTVTLILAIGNHSLKTNFIIRQITYFTMIAVENSSAVIYCEDTSKFEFLFMEQVHIKGIYFTGCLGNKLTSVDEFVIMKSLFTIENRTRYHLFNPSLLVTKSNVVIMDTSFIAHMNGKENNGSIHCTESNVVISNSSFVGNSAPEGGAIYCTQSILIISESVFARNFAYNFGGAIYSTTSVVLISNSTFNGNNADEGGVLYASSHHFSKKVEINIRLNKLPRIMWFNVLNKWNNYFENSLVDLITNLITNASSFDKKIVLIIDSYFKNNTAAYRGGVIFCESEVTLYVLGSNFAFNAANNSYGGVFTIFINKLSPVFIYSSSFKNNSAVRGGVGFVFKSTINISESEFLDNQAFQSSGALLFDQLTKAAVIINSNFYSNKANGSGGSLYIIQGALRLYGSVEFKYNSATDGGVINALESGIRSTGKVTVSNNNCSAFYLSESGFYIRGKSGVVTINNNTATNGAGILAITSRITLESYGTLNVVSNTANDSGGGIYLYHSQLYVKEPTTLFFVKGNNANKYGGGIYCISSEIVVKRKGLMYSHRAALVIINKNSAFYGGGIYFETSSKFYVKGFEKMWLWSGISREYIAQFYKNRALYGGALFVADNTASGMCVNGEVPEQSECFIQILAHDKIIGYKYVYPHIGNIFLFSNNTAINSGAKLFGGLLDRCTVNVKQNNIIRYSDIPDSFSWVLNDDDVTSDPVRVCICNPNSNSVNCSYIPKIQHYRKGSNITLWVAALDQINHVVPATIRVSLHSQRGHFGDGQQAQFISATCTNLNFSIFSPLNESDQLILYAEGPCDILGISSLRIDIEFSPCWCPIGLELDKAIDRCICTCPNALNTIFPLNFIKDSDCSTETLVLARHQDYWITADNLTNTAVTFISYQHCPSIYCHPPNSPVYQYIDFSTLNRTDVQCAFNHTGILCGKCKPNLTLSLGSSRCIECPRLWPLITVAISASVLIGGLLIVVFILVFNMTVAKGTLNTVIFYANILATNQQQFMPFMHPNFCTVFISLLNLNFSFDACFFEGLDAYAKVWLQMGFPAYIILIVIAVIATSSYSRRFSRLIARKNPVATLATLILLSYTKLLHSIIGILSSAILRYTPIDNQYPAFTKVVWLQDGSVNYLKGKHVPLFLSAVLITIVGFMYTFLLLSWQWLIKFSNKKLFCWVSNTKLSSFMDAYHAPYNARNRYWTGLLLLARVILYLTAVINISGDPSVNLLVISLVIGCISLLHIFSGISVYKKWTLNVFEFVTFFNILAFVAFKFYIQIIEGSEYSNIAVAYVSISVQIVVFICSLLNHFVTEFDLLGKIKNCKCFKNQLNRQNIHVPLLDDNQYAPPPVTTTEVSVMKPRNSLKIKSEIYDSERKELTDLLEIETSLK